MKTSQSMMLTAIYAMTHAIFFAELKAGQHALIAVTFAWVVFGMSLICQLYERRDGE